MLLSETSQSQPHLAVLSGDANDLVAQAQSHFCDLELHPLTGVPADVKVAYHSPTLGRVFLHKAEVGPMSALTAVIIVVLEREQ